jgi:hypothetical protein
MQTMKMTASLIAVNTIIVNACMACGHQWEPEGAKAARETSLRESESKSSDALKVIGAVMLGVIAFYLLAALLASR